MSTPELCDQVVLPFDGLTSRKGGTILLVVDQTLLLWLGFEVNTTYRCNPKPNHQEFRAKNIGRCHIKNYAVRKWAVVPAQQQYCISYTTIEITNLWLPLKTRDAIRFISVEQTEVH